MLREHVEQLIGHVEETEIKEAMDIATADIMVNRIGFHVLTTMDEMLQIICRSVHVLRKCERPRCYDGTLQ